VTNLTPESSLRRSNERAMRDLCPFAEVGTEFIPQPVPHRDRATRWTVRSSRPSGNVSP
jgi:hypothetical protein